MGLYNFKTASLEQLKTISQDELLNLPEDEFRDYYERNKELGNEFMFGGEIGEHSPTFYGTPSKRLVKDDSDNWGVSQGAIFPSFSKYPIMLNKEEFGERMENIGVSEDILRQFFEYKTDMENF